MPTLQADVDAVLSFVDLGDFGGFQTIKGLEESAEVVADRVPGAQYPDKSVSGADISNGIVTRSWNEARDRPLYNKLKGRTGTVGSLGVLTRDSARNISNVEPFTVKLVRFRGVEGDTNGGTAKAELEIEVAVTGRA